MDERQGGSQLRVMSIAGQSGDLRSAVACRAQQLSDMDTDGLLDVLDGCDEAQWLLSAAAVPVNRT